MTADDLRDTPGRVGVWSGELRGAGRIGPGSLLAPHQAVVLDTDPDRARNAARAALARE